MKSGKPFFPVIEHRLTGRLWEPGYRERYYQAKFGVPVTDTDFIRQ